MRDRVKFVCMECTEGWDTCFCTTMNSNKTDEYSLAVRFSDDELLFNVKEEEFNKYFEDKKEEDFELKFIEENITKVELPDIKDVEVLNKLTKFLNINADISL